MPTQIREATRPASTVQLPQGALKALVAVGVCSIAGGLWTLYDHTLEGLSLVGCGYAIVMLSLATLAERWLDAQTLQRGAR
ncbi:MAG: hypothetical protein VKP57_13540 [Candidatus Sericytochromatia bacterium]|nr:hypothetical protein [Candidatus Sericytochromatia bacterium]